MAEKTKDTLFIDMKYVILYRKLGYDEIAPDIFVYHYPDTTLTINRLYEYGATYTGKASVCDIFIEYQDGEKEDVRMESIKQVIEKEEKEIKILSLAEAVSLLGLTEKDLNKVDYINCKLYTERKTRKYQKSQTYIDKNDKPTTIGDVLRLQGVDISKFLSED